MVEPVFVDLNLQPADRIYLTGAEAKHAIAVRRMRVGEAISVINGKGLRLRGEVLSVDKERLEIQVNQRLNEKQPPITFTLVQALAKGDRDELAIQTATELGASKIVPWSADRSVSRWEGKKRETGRERWQQIVLEAAKQSLQSFIPEVLPVVNSAELAKQLTEFDLVLVLDSAGTKSLAALELPAAGQIAIVVGPEGGISSEELALFSSFSTVSLGTNILRTSTAGPAVIAALTLGRKQA